ncbi:hypothetical protein A2973_02680 [Candidatus Gottesmanbacteria bacterium RIFCSPLOWO2_01_FULL_49_10]|uniref:RNA polymerase sigma factor n=1 Tax=Candidatus Gottesmanbacteria bacterium RIFCSPLOWO2_01_FULL_49_10 TaxID=1798396 RepID=A0A1F6B1I7_9BACT|nr:MAG: RNA polymerase sigma factor, sigma-70 family [Microgenomates group bacterium GW2011_GWA2_47_8]OGG30804.1 MAG: hypothetical protein A2973_02680 [Candidatus Gottesmanbacteria bacterium RIFCSPLOWO2_01_FULL_49_10]
MIQDHELVQKILARDRRALAGFYHTFTPRLRRFILQKIADPQDAEEVLQDTLFAFLESIRDFSGNARVGTYLYAIASHKVVDFYRRKKIKHIVFSKLPRLEALVSTLLNPEEELDTALVKDKIRHVLGGLLPNYREIILLKYVDEMSVAQIAEKFAVTVKSAESQLFRARRAFVELFLSI